MPLPLCKFSSPMAALVFLVGLLVCGTSGCGSSIYELNVTQPPPGNYTGVAFGGKAMVGKLPLIGAAVQGYAARPSGNGSSATALLANSLTTDANGVFTVAAGYMCPTGASQVYVVARGGKAGAAAGSANRAICLLRALGPCNQIVASSQGMVNRSEERRVG